MKAILVIVLEALTFTAAAMVLYIALVKRFIS